MLKVIKESHEDSLLIKLEGGITERADFGQLIGATPDQLIICGKGVESINSAGIKAWVSFFQKLQRKNVKVRFQEFSPPLVECMNMISNFTCGAPVESIYVPFACSSCQSDRVSLYPVERLSSLDLDQLTEPCPDCAKPMFLDDIPDEYFCFTKRKRS